MRVLLSALLFAALLGRPLSLGSQTPQEEAEDAGMVRVADFYIDVYEYPNRAGALPRVDLTWEEARQLCRARGKRLCTEREWEQACRGVHNYGYGYGPTFENGRCNTPYREGDTWKRDHGPAPSGAFGECANENGVHDLIGNVWEWTAGWYDARRQWHVVRGGSWFNSVNFARADVRYGQYLTPDYHLDLIGFRCCRPAVAGAESH